MTSDEGVVCKFDMASSSPDRWIFNPSALRPSLYARCPHLPLWLVRDIDDARARSARSASGPGRLGSDHRGRLSRLAQLAWQA